MGGWVGGGRGQGGSIGFEFARRMREKVRGSIGLALLYSKKKQLKFASSFTSPEKQNYYFYFTS